MYRICNTLARVTRRGVASRSKLWRPGQTLRISFANGSELLQERVRNAADGWKQCGANIDWEWSDLPKTEVRIGFLRNGQSWSFVGTDALTTDGITMNLGWLYERTEEQELQRVVLHEFGHALGLLHEHQHPEAPFEWNVPLIYDYYQKTQGWDKETVDWNLFEKHDTNEALTTKFCRRSVMEYSFPADFTINGEKVEWENFEIAECDAETLRLMYPW